MDVVALASEQRMRPDAQFDQRVSRRAAIAACAAFATQPQNLAVVRPRRDLDVEHRAIRQSEGLLASIDGVEKVEFETIMRIAAAPADSAAPLPTEDLRDDVVRIREIREA